MPPPRILLIAMLLLVISGGTAFAEETVVRRYSIVAGANDGGEGRVQLRYAETDAQKFAGVMHELGGLSEDDTIVLLDPDKAALEAGFVTMGNHLEATHTGERREVIFYYSGHSDETGLLLGEEQVTYKELRTAMDGLPADVHIIVLDSCSAGTLTRTKGGSMRPPFLVDESSDVRGHAFLTSSSEDEVAQESDAIGGSFFTHYLVSGLRGAADVSDDNRVTLNEAYQFAFSETLERTEYTRSGPQHAAYEIQLSGTGDLVLTDLRSAGARVQFAAPLRGRIYVRDAESTLIAELDKDTNSMRELNLPAGAYTVRIIHDEQLHEATMQLVKDKTHTLGVDDFVALGTEETVARGGPRIIDDAEDTTSPEEAGPRRDEPIERIDTPPALTDDDYTIVPFNIGFVPGVGIADYAPGERKMAYFSLHVLLGGVDRVDGAAVAGLLNWTPDRVDGFQGAGLVASAGQVEGFIGAGLMTRAESVQGAQAAGLLNIGGHIEGAQIGLVNIGDNVNGAQIGLVNISNSTDAPIGLINIIRDGIFNVDVWANEMAAGNVGLKVGGKYLYSLIGVGVAPKLGSDTANTGLDENEFFIDVFAGIGTRAYLGESVWMDVDLSGGTLLDGNGGWTESILSRLRISVGYRFFDHFGIFGGASANVLVQFPDTSGLQISGDYIEVFNVRKGDAALDEPGIWIYPGFFGGLEF